MRKSNDITNEFVSAFRKQTAQGHNTKYATYLKGVVPFLQYTPKEKLQKYIDPSKIDAQAASVLCLEVANRNLLSTVLDIAEMTPKFFTANRIHTLFLKYLAVKEHRDDKIERSFARLINKKYDAYFLNLPLFLDVVDEYSRLFDR
jgi:hypothetical protein